MYQVSAATFTSRVTYLGIVYEPELPLIIGLPGEA